jgi:hypothetical protein
MNRKRYAFASLLVAGKRVVERGLRPRVYGRDDPDGGPLCGFRRRRLRSGSHCAAARVDRDRPIWGRISASRCVGPTLDKFDVLSPYLANIETWG